MTTPLPPSLDTELRDFHRRLERLEMTPRVTNSSVSLGTFRVLDDSGHPVVQMGLLDGTDFGIRVATPESKVFEVLQNGSTYPLQVIPLWMTPAAEKPPAAIPAQHAGWTDLPTDTTLWTGDFFASGDEISVRFLAYRESTETLTWSVRIQERSLTDTSHAPAQTIASGTTIGEQVLSGLTIPTTALRSGTDPRGRFFRIGLAIRRNSGSGKVGLGISEFPRCY